MLGGNDTIYEIDRFNLKKGNKTKRTMWKIYRLRVLRKGLGLNKLI